MRWNLGTVIFILCSLFSPGHTYAITINNASLPEATQYQPYVAPAFSTTGGTAPYTWSVTGVDATLPEGMSLNASTGVISASAVGGQGGYQFQIQVKDSLGATAASLFTISVAADNTLGGCSIFPINSIFHQRVDSLPVDNSPAAPIYSGYQSSHLRVFFGADAGPDPNGIPFIRVPYNQTPANMTFTAYGDESDAPNGWLSNYVTTYPLPANAPIESTANCGANCDRHVLVLQTAGGGQSCKLWEVWQGSYNGNGTWNSSNGAYWDLGSNNLRTNGWTSGDAAGLPIMPLTVNYDEVASGEVAHPIRFTVNHMLNGYVWPARHTAGVGYCTSSSGVIPSGSELSQSSPPLSCTMTGPAGEIYRLTSAAYAAALTTCPSSTNPQANVIITAMRQYGIILADNGLTGGLIGTPDARWNNADLGCLTNFTLSQFEAVNVSSLRQSADSGATSPPPQYALTADANGSGSGTLSTSTTGVTCSNNSCSGTLSSGASAVINAVANVGSTFTGWVGCSSVSGTHCTVIMNSVEAVTATFNLNQYVLTVNASGTGSGTVTSSSGEISYTYPTANSGSVNVNYGNSILLTATASAHSNAAWAGCDSTGGNAYVATCTISSMSGARTAIATFTFTPVWQSIPGAIFSTPTIAWNPVSSKIQMVVQGSGNDIWSSTFNSDGTFNNDWVQIPGAIISPAALAWNPTSNKLHMVVRGSGNTIWASTFSSTGTFNNDWVQIPGAIISPAALAWNPTSNKLHMVVRGSGNTIWSSTFDSTGTFNGDWTQIPGAIVSSPALAWNLVSNKLQMVVQGSGNTIWSSTFNSTGTFNGDWTQIQGSVVSSPALAWNSVSNEVLMVVQGSGNTIWSSTFNSTGTFNGDWAQIPGAVIDQPSIVWNPVKGNLLIVVRATSNSIWAMEY